MPKLFAFRRFFRDEIEVDKVLGVFEDGKPCGKG